MTTEGPGTRDEVSIFRSRMPVSAEELYRWHARPGAFERLAPPWERIQLLERNGLIEDGARLVMKVGRFPPLRWIAEHQENRPGVSFRDVQTRGPFARWVHDHRFEATPDGSSELVDHVRWAMPGGPFGRLLAPWVQRSLTRMFTFRHRTTREDLLAHAQVAHHAHMRVVISGASGLVGKALSGFLTSGGHQVLRLVRTEQEAKEKDTIFYEGRSGTVDKDRLEGVDAVVHLAGANIAAGRWTETRKTQIVKSRVLGTETLARAIATLEHKPKVFLCASAVGFFGDRGDEVLDEGSEAGSGFLADTCRAWEAAAAPAVDAGVRTTFLRLGAVLDPRGGALQKMLTPFRLGIAGRLGSGRQWMSWIALDDVVSAMHHLLTRADLHGVFVGTSPNPVTNAEFTRTLGRVLRRPTVLPAPAFALRMLLGEMADALLLASTRAVPTRLLQSGYSFRLPELEDCLRHVLGRT